MGHIVYDGISESVVETPEALSFLGDYFHDSLNKSLFIFFVKDWLASLIFIFLFFVVVESGHYVLDKDMVRKDWTHEETYCEDGFPKTTKVR